jgi:hypothetical protein
LLARFGTSPTSAAASSRGESWDGKLIDKGYALVKLLARNELSGGLEIVPEPITIIRNAPVGSRRTDGLRMAKR